MPTILRNFRPNAFHRSIAFALVALTVLAAGCIAEDDLTLDQRHRHLTEQLMCPVCDGQSIDQSSAAISEDMKSVIWQQLENGRSNAQIRDYFVERYGEAVLAAPTSAGINITAWVLPAVIAAFGLAVVGTAYVRMRMPRMRDGETNPNAVSATGKDDPADDELEPYLQRVDAEFESSIRNTSGR